MDRRAGFRCPITALVLALAGGASPPPEALTKLREISREIQAKKDDYRRGALDRTRAALTELGENDAAGLAGLLAEFGRKGRGTAPATPDEGRPG